MNCTPTDKKRHYLFLDGLRGVAALMVLVHARRHRIDSHRGSCDFDEILRYSDKEKARKKVMNRIRPRTCKMFPF